MWSRHSTERKALTILRQALPGAGKTRTVVVVAIIRGVVVTVGRTHIVITVVPATTTQNSVAAFVPPSLSINDQTFFVTTNPVSVDGYWHA